MRALTVLLGSLWASSAMAQSADTIAIVGATVHPGDGTRIESATVLLRDGRIAEVGASVSVPANAVRVDGSGKIVTPGLIDVATSTGLVEVSSLSDTRDASVEDDDPIRAAFRVRDGLNPHSIVIPVTRLGGVTTVGSLPSGGIVSGQGLAMDLDGAPGSATVVLDRVAMVASFNPSAAESAGGARGMLALRIRELVREARALESNGAASGNGASRLDLEAIAEAVADERRFWFRSSRAADLDVVLALAGELDLAVALLGAEEGWRRAEALAEAGVPVVVKPYGNLPLQFDRLGTRFDNAALLAEAGVTVVLSTFDTHNARNLRHEAGQAVRHGMDWEAALTAVTRAPAELLGVGETHGTLAPGKIANVVVWSGDPFEPSSAAEHVFIRGREIEHDSRQIRLLERYRTLDEGPVQYRGRR